MDFDTAISIAYEALAIAANRWEAYCIQHNYDSGAEGQKFFAAYALRRINGSFIDHARGEDWLTRSARSRAGALRDAGQDEGRTEAELAAATQMTIAQVRATLADLSRRPVTLEVDLHDKAGHEDTESEASATALLTAAVSAMKALPAVQQVVLVLHWYAGVGLDEVAGRLAHGASGWTPSTPPRSPRCTRLCWQRPGRARRSARPLSFRAPFAEGCGMLARWRAYPGWSWL